MSVGYLEGGEKGGVGVAGEDAVDEGAETAGASGGHVGVGVGVVQATQQLEAAAEERQEISGRSGGRAGAVLRELREGDQRQPPGALQLIGVGHRRRSGKP